MVIQDLEQMDTDKKKQKELKRKHRDVFGYGSGEEISDDSDDEGGANKLGKTSLKRKAKDSSNVNVKDLGKLQGQSASSVIKQMEADKKAALAKKGGPTAGLKGAAGRREQKALAKKGGHRVVQSGDAYKSDKGKGDMLKAGKHEPYAYF